MGYLGVSLALIVAMVVGQFHALTTGYFRFYSVVITAVFIFFAFLIANEYFQELKNSKNKIEGSSDLDTLKARLKVSSEYFSLVALLGFILTQYRAGLEIDGLMTNRAITDDIFFSVVQSIALVGLLLAATLAIGRKLAIAWFERYQAFEKIQQRNKEKNSEGQTETRQVTATATISVPAHATAFATAQVSSASTSASATASTGTFV